MTQSTTKKIAPKPMAVKPKGLKRLQKSYPKRCALHSTLLICNVTHVTGVTALIHKGFFCNAAHVTGVTDVTKLHPKRCALHSTSLICGVTEVTGVTALIHKGFFCNPRWVTGVTRVTKLHPKPHRLRRCATVQTGARHTMKQAGHHPETVVFSRPKFTVTGFPVAYGYGAGSAYPRGRQHGLFHVDIPSPTTLWPIQSFGGFSVQQGTKP